MSRKRVYGSGAERVAAWRSAQRQRKSIAVAVEPNPYRVEVEGLRKRVAELEAENRQLCVKWEAALAERSRGVVALDSGSARPAFKADAGGAGDRCPGCGGLWVLIGRTHLCRGTTAAP